jgi:hypothetical protein
MSTKKNKVQKKFNVWANLRQTVSVEIVADSLEDALAKAKNLDEEVFVDVLGEYMDGEFEITGVLANDAD